MPWMEYMLLEGIWFDPFKRDIWPLCNHGQLNFKIISVWTSSLKLAIDTECWLVDDFWDNFSARFRLQFGQLRKE